ncbi:MAG: hypothetical protein Q3X42_03515, partial [Eggerthellaceae bacterium]|nr:hypothetical protein [Eggerthellaceae bacterium]
EQTVTNAYDLSYPTTYAAEQNELVLQSLRARAQRLREKRAYGSYQANRRKTCGDYARGLW